MNLIEYVRSHTKQGRCTCGKCLPEQNAPMFNAGDHTIDMEFFEVGIVGTPAKDEYLKLMAEHKGEFGDCDPVDGKEHGYMELGGWIGDQGLAMCCMALGVHLGVFKLLTPSTVMPFLEPSMKMRMAESGMVCVMKAA